MRNRWQTIKQLNAEASCQSCQLNKKSLLTNCISFFIVFVIGCLAFGYFFQVALLQLGYTQNYVTINPILMVVGKLPVARA